MSKPFVSVVVATRKRLGDLEECLASLCAQDYSKDNYEVIVVDQGTEGIGTLVERYGSQDRVRLVSQEVANLSLARNTGVENARGEYIAFIDDDAVAAGDWLSNLVGAYTEDGIGIVGGRILPRWPERVRRRYARSDYARSLLSLFDLGDVDVAVSRVIGCNFSVRKRLWQEFGGFDAKSGRTGAVLLSGEETEFCERVGDRYKVVYCATAVVHHKIPSERLALKWLAKRSYYGGLSKALQGRKPRPIAPMQLLWFDYVLLCPYIMGLLAGTAARMLRPE